MANTIEHIIFTPFCSNRFDEWKSGLGRKRRARVNTRSTNYLESRIRYLEGVCFASISAQKNQNFKWILAIDPDLPERFVQRLEKLVASRSGSILHRINDARWERIEWIKTYLSSHPTTTYLVTTNLDSDDGLDRQFTQYVKELVLSNSACQPVPPIRFLGFRDVVQWDLIRSQNAPYGWKAGWHRPNRHRLTSAGFTVVAQYPQYPVMVTGIRHAIAHKALDFSMEDPAIHDLYSIRRHACTLANDLGEDLQSWPVSRTVLPLDDQLGPPLMLNHKHTIQSRLKEKKPGRQLVLGPESLPNVAVDWNLLWHGSPMPGDRRRRIFDRITSALR